VLTFKEVAAQVGGDPFRNEAFHWSWTVHLFPLAERANDRDCWDALVRTAKKLTTDSRLTIIRNFGWVDPETREDPIRKERICGLLAFVDDREEYDADQESGARVEIRDFATEHLAALLGVPVKRDLEASVVTDSDRGPLTRLIRLIRREAVRRTAERELAKPEK
jgi:hypothetical protein